MTLQNAYCYRSGQIGFRNNGTGIPDGSLPIKFNATPEEVERIKVRARLGYDNKTWLVPGVPEADDEEAAYTAFTKFIEFCDFERPEKFKTAKVLRGKS